MIEQTHGISLLKKSSREIRLDSRPKGMPTAANFPMARVDLEPFQGQQVSVRNHLLSVDPCTFGLGRDYAVLLVTTTILVIIGASLFPHLAT